MKTFIVETWDAPLRFLRWISPARLAFQLFPKLRSPGAVDAYVLANSVFAVGAAWFTTIGAMRWYDWCLVGYGSVRVTEIVVKQTNVLLFDEWRSRRDGRSYELVGYRRSLLLSMHNYIELVLWFALFMRRMPASFANSDSFLDAVTLSFASLTGFGYSEGRPVTTGATVLYLVESAIGLFMVLLILARVIGLLPTPRSRDELDAAGADADQRAT